MTNASLTNLIEQTILDQMRCKAAFTALDISNTLKFERYPVTHREVAAAVREIYASGAMGYFDYERKVIPVVTERGTKRTQAFLYHFAPVSPRTYQTRDQDALPPVPPEAARDMAQYTPVGPLPVLPPDVRGQRRIRRGRTRRDGALGIPRQILTRLGWSDGQALALTAHAGEVSLHPADGGSAALRVWVGSRLRVCRTKLRGGDLKAGSVTITVEGNNLRIRAERQAAD